MLKWFKRKKEQPDATEVFSEERETLDLITSDDQFTVVQSLATSTETANLPESQNTSTHEPVESYDEANEATVVGRAIPQMETPPAIEPVTSMSTSDDDAITFDQATVIHRQVEPQEQPVVESIQASEPPPQPSPPVQMVSAPAEPVSVESSDSQPEVAEDTLSNFENPQNDSPEKNLGRIDKALLVASLVIFITSVCLLFSDGLFTNVDTSNLTPIGKITSLESDVRRKVTNGLAWDSIANSERVFEGDSIFTGDKSKTKIELESGTSFEIDEKSLVVVRTKNGALELDLQYGSLTGSIKTDKPVFLINEGQRTQLKSDNKAELRIKRTEGARAAKIEVLKGEVQVGTRKVVENQEAEPVKAPTTALSISLLEPSNGAQIWRKPSQAIGFRWKTKKDTGPLKLEFARDTAFNDIVQEVAVTGTESLVPEFPDNDGTLYWRVRDLDKMNLSVPRKLVLHLDVPPLLALPENKQEVSLTETEDAKTVNFAWDDDSGSREWRLQVSKTNEFAEILQDVKAAKKRVQSKPLQPGQYYWRVVGLSANRQSPPWSEPSTFTVVGSGELSAPQLTNKLKSFEIPAAALVRNKDVKGPIKLQPTEAPTLEWSEVPRARGYVLEITSEKDFKKASKVKVAQGTSFKLDRVTPKTFWYRVSAIGRNDKPTAPSEAGELNVTLPAPKFTPIKPIVQKFESAKAANAAKTSVDLKWSPVTRASGYEVEFSKSADFKESRKLQLKDTIKKLTVQNEGRYHFRVRAVDPKGQAISAFSKPTSLEYTKNIVPPKLVEVAKPVIESTREVAAIPPTPQVQPSLGTSNVPAPKLKDPAPETSVVGFGKSPVFLNFRWKPVPNAVGYKVEVAATPDFSSPIASQSTKSANYFFEKTLPKGKLYWRVRAELENSVTDWSAPNTFNVSYK